MNTRQRAKCNEEKIAELLRTAPLRVTEAMAELEKAERHLSDRIDDRPTMAEVLELIQASANGTAKAVGPELDKLRDENDILRKLILTEIDRVEDAMPQREPLESFDTVGTSYENGKLVAFGNVKLEPRPRPNPVVRPGIKRGGNPPWSFGEGFYIGMIVGVLVTTMIALGVVSS